MSSGSRKVFIVTGANRGIGAAICDAILSHPSTRSQPLTLHATSRKGNDIHIRAQHDTQRIVSHPLDISKQQSIASFRETVLQETPTIDVLVNNAGINLDSNFNIDNARMTLKTNYEGSLAMCQAFIPQMREGGRIVNLSSTASGLSIYSSSIRERFRSAQSLDEVEQLAQAYLTSLSGGTCKEDGWPVGRSYSVSKACMNAFTAVLAAQHPKVTINSCCPGWIKSDMGNLMGRPPKTPAEGAKIPVRLALEDLSGITGRYWGNGSVYDTGSGDVREW